MTETSPAGTMLGRRRCHPQGGFGRQALMHTAIRIVDDEAPRRGAGQRWRALDQGAAHHAGY